VVGNKTGNVSVSIDITNATDEAKKFNVLCLIMDMDPTMPTGYNAAGGTYQNGEPVYPNFKSPGTTWPFFPAIKQTALLNPGQTETVTWASTYTCGSGQWRVWCSGLTDSWTNP